VPNTPRHAALRAVDRRLDDRAVRTVCAGLAAVLLLALGTATAPGRERPAARREVASVRLSAQVRPEPVAVRPPARKVVKHRAAARPRPRPAAPTKRPVRRPRAAVTRWLPSGTGMWLHQFDRSERGNPRAVVGKAEKVGLSHLFVRTGSSTDGWIGTPTLSALLPATRGTGIRVIAWDFPTLVHPDSDALRLAHAAWFRCSGCPRVAAVAPDVETASEGTRIGPAAVVRYYSRLREALPPDVAILATVPWPSEQRTGRYPYAQTARWADAFLPMAYWYNRSPGGVTATSMRYLQRFHHPVMPVGQGYDGRLDAPYLAPDRHPYLSVRSFLLTARQQGARAVSLWSWQTTGAQQWRALRGARALYARR
jgi:hypothetical protein